MVVGPSIPMAILSTGYTSHCFQLYTLHNELRDSSSENDSPILSREQNNKEKETEKEDAAPATGHRLSTDTVPTVQSSQSLTAPALATPRNPTLPNIQFNPVPGTYTPPVFSSATSINNFLGSGLTSPNR